MENLEFHLSGETVIKRQTDITTTTTTPTTERQGNNNRSNFLQLDSKPKSNFISDLFSRFIMGKPLSKQQQQQNGDVNSSTPLDTNQVTNMRSTPNSLDSLKDQEKSPTQATASQNGVVKRACKAPPLPRRFGQICNCGQSNHNRFSTPNDGLSGLGPLPLAAYTSPLHLYDPHTKKCLPTSRNRDMLLKECHLGHSFNPFQSRQSHVGVAGNYSKGNCYYDDLVCDPRKFRCICKPSLHLFYDNNLTAFKCMPINEAYGSPDGKVNCRPGYVYNVVSKECQKVFDINDIHTGMSTTQYSFATIIIIWILLLILIVIAKVRKLRTTNMQYLYSCSPQSERRIHHGSGGNYARHHHGTNRSNWLHPFIAAVNGHHHLAPNRRTTVHRLGPSVTGDESGNYNDTDFFLGSNGAGRRLGDNNFTESQQSLNNPPPKFEEIYPSCPINTAPPNNIEGSNLRPPPSPPPPPNEDLPSYDEAMKLQNTMPPDINIRNSDKE